MTNTEITSAAHITYLTEMVAPYGARVDEDGTISAAALDVLADLDDQTDGYFDGTHIWIGGTKYHVFGAAL